VEQIGDICETAAQTCSHKIDRGNNVIHYSVTVFIDDAIESDWLQWMRGEHIPDVMNTGCFLHCRLVQLIDPSVKGRAGYRIDYTAPSADVFEKYRSEFAPALQADHTTRYEGRFDASRTISEAIGEWSTSPGV
jgi:hypothetical protein